MKFKTLSLLVLIFLLACTNVNSLTDSKDATSPSWLLVDDFESNDLSAWINKDTRNDTDPKIENPQVTIIQQEQSGNRYLLKKPAAEGVIGNRKALSYRKLPEAVEVGEVYTFYARFAVEAFPNNHIFGLSNLTAEGIARHDYNAFEPSLRITDKTESDGSKNDGTLMVKQGKGYAKIVNAMTRLEAEPLVPKVWYEVWMVANNILASNGGQTYDVYLRGGEFETQQLVYQSADFRMKRELPLQYFLANCNTGPKDKPYGNGGVLYDDIYMAEGVELSSPTNNK